MIEQSLHSTQNIIGHFRDETLQAIDVAGIYGQTHNNQQYTQKIMLRRTNLVKKVKLVRFLVMKCKTHTPKPKPKPTGSGSPLRNVRMSMHDWVQLW